MEKDGVDMPTSKRRKFLITDNYGEPLFNSDSQNHFFKSLRACKKAIKEYLEEEVSETTDDKGNWIRYTRAEDEKVGPDDYLIFEQVADGNF